VPDSDQDFESGAADRLIFFSDAVVAIAITLLALDLPVPEGTTLHDFWASVRHNDGSYLAFLISFAVIAIAWGHHHHVFRYAARSDSRLRSLNLLWLLMIVLNPFATRVLTFNGNDALTVHALRFGFYALLQVVESAAFVAMVHHMVNHNLQAANMPAGIVAHSEAGSYPIMAGFGISIPIFFLTTYGWVAWIVVPFVLERYLRRRLRIRS
jgi:uncharacterized membrane protein